MKSALQSMAHSRLIRIPGLLLLLLHGNLNVLVGVRHGRRGCLVVLLLLMLVMLLNTFVALAARIDVASDECNARAGDGRHTSGSNGDGAVPTATARRW